MRACAYISMAAMVGPCVQHPMVLEAFAAARSVQSPIYMVDLAKEGISREEFVERVAKLAGSLYDAALEL